MKRLLAIAALGVLGFAVALVLMLQTGDAPEGRYGEFLRGTVGLRPQLPGQEDPRSDEVLAGHPSGYVAAERFALPPDNVQVVVVPPAHEPTSLTNPNGADGDRPARTESP